MKKTNKAAQSGTGTETAQNETVTNVTPSTETTNTITGDNVEVIRKDEEMTEQTVVNKINESKLDTGETVLRSEVDKDIPTVEGKVIKVVGEKIVMAVKVKKEDGEPETKTIAIPKTTQRSVLAHIPGVGDVIIKFEKISDKPGRPVDPTSERQKRLNEMEERRNALKAQGIELKRGRPTVEGSERQKRLAEQAKRAQANGGVAQRGRPAQHPAELTVTNVMELSVEEIEALTTV